MSDHPSNADKWANYSDEQVLAVIEKLREVLSVAERRSWWGPAASLRDAEREYTRRQADAS